LEAWSRNCRNINATFAQPRLTYVNVETTIDNTDFKKGSSSYQAVTLLPGTSGVCDKLLYFRFDGVPNPADANKSFLFRPGQGRWVFKSPMEPFGHSGEDRTTFGTCLVADCHNVIEMFPLFQKIEYAFGLILGDVNADFMHRFHDQRVQDARLDARTFHIEEPTSVLLQKSFGHLAPGAVVDANEQDFFFHESPFHKSVKRRLVL
jgi:hypothetical protein